MQGHFEDRERDQLHVQHATAYGRGGFKCRDFGEAEGGLPAPDTSRWSDQCTESTGKDATGSRVAGKEGGYQENILQEIMMRNHN